MVRLTISLFSLRVRGLLHLVRLYLHYDCDSNTEVSRYWFPGYIATFLSVFAFVTWIKPNNVTINQVFGGWTGISVIPITFDWTQITGYNLKSPLIPPWFAIANTLMGTVFWYMIVTAGLHFSGHWYAKYLPISDSNSYDNTGHLYNVTKILTPEYTLDIAKYQVIPSILC